jgi:hypothetical protein
MSFDLGVWKGDVAVTNEEAAEIYVKLCKSELVQPGESNAIEDFYNELTARWVEIDTAPDY